MDIQIPVIFKPRQTMIEHHNIERAANSDVMGGSGLTGEDYVKIYHNWYEGETTESMIMCKYEGIEAIIGTHNPQYSKIVINEDKVYTCPMSPTSLRDLIRSQKQDLQ